MTTARSGTSGLLQDPSARALIAGDLEAIFLPGHGMLGASLRRKNVELLGRVEDLQTAAANGSTAGIPFLHPWANRLAGPRYRAAGREVNLDLSSSLLHFDERGLPIHGVPWSLLAWEVTDARADFLAARFDWSRSDLLALFPFRHHLEMAVTLHSDSLAIETTLVAGHDGPVPVSFGFHPYFGISEVPRAEWRLELPAMRRLVLDEHGIPTGEEKPFDRFDAHLGENDFDDGFALMKEQASLRIEGAGRRITVEFLRGYPYTQVFAPKDKNYIALEPMTAPANALASGRGLRLVEPGGNFQAVFRISIDGSQSK
ncbi:MAG TPA: aldose 1-epimerase [Candidatus Binatia bacterium]|nr:aldose 1-epimerase [Candidatus Binatia bacterium]